MINKAVEVIWIFSAGQDGWTGIKGTIRGPRGPKKLPNFSQVLELIETILKKDPFLIFPLQISGKGDVDRKHCLLMRNNHQV